MTTHTHIQRKDSRVYGTFAPWSSSLVHHSSECPVSCHSSAFELFQNLKKTWFCLRSNSCDIVLPPECAKSPQDAWYQPGILLTVRWFPLFNEFEASSFKISLLIFSDFNSDPPGLQISDGDEPQPRHDVCPLKSPSPEACPSGCCENYPLQVTHRLFLVIAFILLFIEKIFPSLPSLS